MIKSLYKTFQRWSEKGSVYILSDLHLGDSDCKLIDKNWVSPKKQIEIINSIIHKDDTFICLGDVGSPELASQIKAGYKVLILGNHDRRKDYESIFDEIYDGAVFIADRILLSHEPVSGMSWCLNIHGHDHNMNLCDSVDCKHINLAANVCGYTPVSLGKIIKDGALSGIKDIHRQSIDRQIERKLEKVKADDEERYILSEWGCLLLTLNDYGINIDKIPGRVGKHIVEDFMELMCKAGYIVRNESQGKDYI